MGNDLLGAMKSQFRLASKEVCAPKPDYHADLNDAAHVRHKPPVGQSVRQISETGKSSAQVAPSVQRQAVSHRACGLKPENSRVSHIGIRFTTQEREFVVQQAKKSCLTLSEYIRASSLGPGYAATIDPMKRQLLQDAIRELNRQGNNLNQIARQLNTGHLTPEQGERELTRLERALIAAQRAVRHALTEGKSY